MQTYTLVYNAADFHPDAWEFLAGGAAFMLLGLFLIRFSGRPKVTWFSNWPPHPIFAWFFFLFATLWTVLAGTGVVGGWLEVHNALADKTYHVISGPVTDFKPMPKEGHA